MTEVCRLEEVAPAPRGAAVTVGTFDGVHRGHQSVMARLVALAGERDLEAVVVTFDRHPASVVRPEAAPALLTDLDHRLELLAATGVERVVVVPFDAARAAQEPEAFVTDLLVGSVGARLVLVGPDFRFGRGRRGDAGLLADVGGPLGLEVVVMDPFTGPAGTAPVSSTGVRDLLARGEVASAGRLLGRPHELRGVVVAGDGRGGAELGYPTANLAVAPGVLVPGLGIYAGWYRSAGLAEAQPAAVSIGVRPTFGSEGADPVIEAHLLDFTGDLYGQAARLQLVDRLRPEVRFDSVAELAAQIDRDVAEARTVLGVL